MIISDFVNTYLIGQFHQFPQVLPDSGMKSFYWKNLRNSFEDLLQLVAPFRVQEEAV